MVKRPDTLRPGVYVHTCVARAGAQGTPAQRAGLAGQVGQGAPVGPALIGTPEELEPFGTGSALYEMGLAALAQGCGPFWVAAAGEDYAAALSALSLQEGVGVLVSDGEPQALLETLKTAAQAGREQVGVVPVGDPEEAVAAAGALDSARAAVVCDGGQDTHATAAAFGVQVAAQGASGSLNGLWVDCPPPGQGGLTPTQSAALLAAGVCPFEPAGEGLRCVRAVTTHTGEGRTWADLSAVLAVDQVVRGVREAVSNRLGGLKNSAATRESIASQILVELEAQRQLGLIDRYDAPVVAAHPQDPAVCVATLRFQVAPELGQVLLAAEILV